jgi:hypothetical protein
MRNERLLLQACEDDVRARLCITKLRRTRSMKLYVEPMDAVLVDVDADRRVRFDNEDWSMPTLQEQRAIIYAARQEIAALTELLEILDA